MKRSVIFAALLALTPILASAQPYFPPYGRDRDDDWRWRQYARERCERDHDWCRDHCRRFEDERIACRRDDRDQDWWRWQRDHDHDRDRDHDWRHYP